MKLSLRKANKLQSRIIRKIHELESDIYSTSVRFNIYTDVEDIVKSLQEKNVEWNSNMETYQNLVNVLANLRRDIATLNASSGISALLATLNALNLEMRALERLTVRGHAVSEFRPSKDHIERQLDGLIERFRESASSMRTEDSTSFSILSELEIKQLENKINLIKAEIEGIHDRLEDVNATTLLEINANIEEILKAQNLL